MSRIKSAPNWMLLFAASGSIAISLLHVAIPLLGPWAYGYFGAAELMPAATAGSLTPALVTWALAAFFALIGVYALSGAHLIRTLPGLPIGLAFAGAVYSLRGFLLIPEAVQLFQGTLIPPRRALFSGVSLLLGLLYMGGLIVLRLRHQKENVTTT